MIQLHHLSIAHSADSPLLTDACAHISRGTLTALIGRNGSGKSSLLRVMSGAARPRGGHVSIDGIDPQKASPRRLARTVALVTTERIRVANLRCADVVALGRAPFTNWLGHMQQADRQFVDCALAMVGMIEFATRTIASLSDGEMQRIMLARALAQDTPVILLDEPTSFLDVANRRQLIRLMAELAHQHQKTILYSTHELDLALHSSDSVMLVTPPQLRLLPPAEMAAYLAANHTFE